MSNALLIGQTLGSYKVVSVIGQGGMGQVYLAEHPLIGKKVAVKVLLPQYSNDAEIVNRFFNEARSATLIKHPGIVEILDFGKHADGSAFIIMEFLEGESLAERLRREQPLQLEVGVEIVRQMCGALGAAHNKGIVHRDLKPDNVYLVPDSDMPFGIRIKLLDFGIAKLGALQGGGASKTRTGMMMGTPQYMSPEQCRGAGNVDHRADIYSLGCMMFEMAAGRSPFIFEGAGEVMAAHIFQPAPRLSELVPGVSPILEQVVARALTKPPDARFQSVAEVAHALDTLGQPRVSARLPVTTPPPAMTPIQRNTPDARTKLPSTTLQGAASEVGTVPASLTPPRRGWVIPVTMGVLAAVGAVGFILFHHPAEDAQPAPAVAAQPEAAKPAEIAQATKPAEVAQPAKPEAAKPDDEPTPEVTKVHLTVASDPPGAEVYRAADGVRVGTTPLEMSRLSTDGEIVFTVKLAGYNDERVVLAADHDGAGEAKLHHKHSSSSSSSSSGTKKKVKNGVLDPFGN